VVKEAKNWVRVVEERSVKLGEMDEERDVRDRSSSRGIRPPLVCASLVFL
jgi:hypothetical protein